MSPSTSVSAASPGTPGAIASPPPMLGFQITSEIARLLVVLKEQQLISRKVTQLLLPIIDVVIRAKLQQSLGKTKREAVEGQAESQPLSSAAPSKSLKFQILCFVLFCPLNLTEDRHGIKKIRCG